MKPQEQIKQSDLIKKMQEWYPNIEVRLSKPGDPELYSVFINFYPESLQLRANTPPEESASNLPEREPDPGE